MLTMSRKMVAVWAPLWNRLIVGVSTKLLEPKMGYSRSRMELGWVYKGSGSTCGKSLDGPITEPGGYNRAWRELPALQSLSGGPYTYGLCVRPHSVGTGALINITTIAVITSTITITTITQDPVGSTRPRTNVSSKRIPACSAQRSIFGGSTFPRRPEQSPWTSGFRTGDAAAITIFGHHSLLCNHRHHGQFQPDIGPIVAPALAGTRSVSSQSSIMAPALLGAFQQPFDCSHL